MKFSGVRIAILAAGLAIGLAAYLAPVEIRDQLNPDSRVKSFQFVGCAGDVDNKQLQAKAWRKVVGNDLVVLVSHPETCGYDVATDPVARLGSNELRLSYSLSSSSGMLAACYCEYLAKFTLSSRADRPRLTIDGQSAVILKGWPDGR